MDKTVIIIITFAIAVALGYCGHVFIDAIMRDYLKNREERNRGR